MTAAARATFGQKGAIVTVRLRNFMTYSDCTLKPAGNLNMIIGPNGSGKSAIVCAIIVGLAGDVSLTGRANNIVSLVRKGSESASTMIELWSGRSDKKNWIIERKITITSRTEGKLDHKSDWLLNGKPVNMKAIKILTKELNIKVDNLCQFLPQDSVASFVKMSHSELLVNTLKAAGDNQLVEDLDKLIKLTSEITDQTQDLDQLEKSSKENEVNARRLQTEVERLREREVLAEQKKICTKKLTYLKYAEARAVYKNATDVIKTSEIELRQAESRGQPFEHEIEVNKTQEKRLAEQLVKLNSESRIATNKMSDHKHSLDELKIQCQEAYVTFKVKEDAQCTRASKLQLKRHELEGYESRYEELRSLNHTKEISNLETSINLHKEKMMEKNSSLRTLDESRVDLVRRIETTKRERDDIIRIKDKKLNLIKSRRNDLYNVIDWLTKHQDKFEQQVFLPMLCEINVIESSDASVVEHAIPESDRWAFICQTEHDLKYLTRVARTDLKTNINVILTPDRTAADFEREMADVPSFPKQHLRAFLKDLISAPEPILRVLYGQYNFHCVPVFTKETTEAELKKLMTTLRKFYVHETFYQIAKSRYDGATLTATDTVRPARDLIYSLDTKRLDEKSRALESLQRNRVELDTEYKDCSAEHVELERQWREMVQRLNDLNVKQGEKKRVETLLAATRRAIEELETSNIDIEAERNKLQDQVTTINLKMVDELDKISSMANLFSSTFQRVSISELLRLLARRNSQLAKKKYEQAMVDAKRLRENIERLKSQINRMKREVVDAKLVAEEKIPGFSNGKLDEATKSKFDSVEQDSVEELEIRIEELKARIHGICRDPNNAIISDYNRQTEELRDKRARILALKNSIQALTASCEETKASFIPTLKDVIKDIDDHYREFMQKLNYDGRVELEYDETRPNDFNEYGIRILVKYRDEEKLIALTSTRQSGGERSVATMIYMLALQTQTTVPFRVVDEINQGMDKDNERKVFELLVRTADESSSQYFLVSPKLLSGLDYGDKMQIHVIFNGPKLEYSFNDMTTNEW